MQRFIALPNRLREHGIAQMKTDVCIYPKRDSHGELTGVLIAHVGALLFFGTPIFRQESIQAIQTFRTGALETITQESPITFT